MATIINTRSNRDDSVSIILAGVILTIIIVSVLFMYGLPTTRAKSQNPQSSMADINLRLPNDTAPITALKSNSNY